MLFDAHPVETCRIAVLPNGDDSFAARIQALRNADTSVRIQALIFTGDESGLYIAEFIKEKKAQGLDVRVIVDAMSNPGCTNPVDVFRSEAKRGFENVRWEALETDSDSKKNHFCRCIYVDSCPWLFGAGRY